MSGKMEVYMAILEQEKKYFEEILPSLLRSSSNQFAVVSGAELIGVYSTIEEAYTEAVKKVGLKDMLVRKVGERETNVEIPALALGLLSANNPHTVIR
jgi:hypothetical protein